MPGPEASEKVIGDRTLVTQGLGAVTATEVFCRIFRMVPTAFKARTGDALRDVIAGALSDLLARPADVIYCAKAFGKATKLAVVSPEFPERGAKFAPLDDVEEAFRGRWSEYTEFLQWQVEVNFGDFLAVVLARFFRAEVSPSSSTPPSPSSGPAGDSSSASA